jgi:PAS domain S-box-containing protein
MLLDFLTKNRSRIIGMLCQSLHKIILMDSYSQTTEIEARVVQGMEAFLEALQYDDLAPVDDLIANIVVSRTVEEFPLALLHAGVTACGELFLPLLSECYGDDTSRMVADLQRLHVLKDAILQRLVGQYETLARTVFQQRQERLREEYQTQQDFNESIIQSMTSGLLVGDKDTHRILKVNRAMEHFSGFSAADVVGKTVEEVFAGLHGLPIREFAEEVERQGTITLRKHRLYTDDGREFYRSIKGQVFYDQQGKNRGVIVIIDDISRTELLRETFSRYLSPQVLEQVLADKQRPSLQSVRRDLTVLFVDIRNFTRFAELHQPEEVVEVLNQYLDIMVDVLFKYQGTLDKFLGDGLLALFGTPLPQADHSQRAVLAALEIQQAIGAFNTSRSQQGAMTLDMGIGINSGEAIVGNIGSERRMEYTVVGDMVNVAHRLQAQAQGGEVLISDTTLAYVRELVTVYATVEAQVKGRQQPVCAHRIGPRLAPPT